VDVEQTARGRHQSTQCFESIKRKRVTFVLDVLAHICNPSTRKAKAGGS
jgi:hypothetical protein